MGGWFRCVGGAAVALTILVTGTAVASPGARLQDRVLHAGELAGFTPVRLEVKDDPAEWAKLAPGSLVDVERRLRGEGFVAAVREELGAGSDDRGALSIVVQLRSAAAARTELARQLRDYASQASRLPGHTYVPFAVTGIPRARGFASRDPSGGSGINVIFADGTFVYHVGAGWGRGAGHPPTRRAVILAAEHLYKRVHAG
jgi:hypothetical protein